ncbi:hypothetical protein A5696_22250 [Mycobacterium sp. E2699]|uniref:hypothetical protein n=1 Tax=Mycobacterium sp. E2699 TaxID=1834137 RepID=UPI000801202D|nr:hypothetical protein [Mycobacterium sp. E2699]OBH07404.1 hypothetical protein A5696_22250 [Mycobacterium sp. E2699]
MAALLRVGAVVGCERTTGGTAVRNGGRAPSTSSAAPRRSDPAEPVPGGAPGFDAAKFTAMQQFAVVIP